jgi:hypothetical protein
MTPAHQHRQPDPPYDLPLHPGERRQGWDLMDERHLQAAIAQLGEQPLTEGSGPVQHDVRVVGVEGGQHRRDHLLGQQGHPGAEHPGLATAHAADPFQGIFGIGQQATRIVQQLNPGLGELHVPARPLEQLDAERSLKPGDRLRQTRLADEQPGRRPPEMQFFPDAHEVAQMAELHFGLMISEFRAGQEDDIRLAHDPVRGTRHC